MEATDVKSADQQEKSEAWVGMETEVAQLVSSCTKHVFLSEHMCTFWVQRGWMESVVI